MNYQKAMREDPRGFNLTCEKCGECIKLPPDFSGETVTCSCGHVNKVLPLPPETMKAFDAFTADIAKNLGFETK